MKFKTIRGSKRRPEKEFSVFAEKRIIEAEILLILGVTTPI